MKIPCCMFMVWLVLLLQSGDVAGRTEIEGTKDVISETQTELDILEQTIDAIDETLAMLDDINELDASEQQTTYAQIDAADAIDETPYVIDDTRDLFDATPDAIFETRELGVLDLVQSVSLEEQEGLDKCNLCVQFGKQALSQLLNIVVQGGVMGGCSGLCSNLGHSTSRAVGTACNLLCDFVGVEAFVQVVKKADLDPYYYCEQLTLCEVKKNGDAKFTTFKITPKSGPQGERVLHLLFESQNGTGAGQLLIRLQTIDRKKLSWSFVMSGVKPGMYKTGLTINAVADPNCDRFKQRCEMWMPGMYIVQVALCSGECGSKHKYHKTYDIIVATFTITK